jgi:predicted nucleic acid-binding protein
MTSGHGLLVTDSSAAVAVLASRGALGEWTSSVLAGSRLAAPWLMPFEAGNALRRSELAGHLKGRAAQLAHVQLRALRVELWPHSRLAERAWQLRGSVTYYDASYVALAELLDVPLVTLDHRLARTALTRGGPRCAFLTPPEPD